MKSAFQSSQIRLLSLLRDPYLKFKGLKEDSVGRTRASLPAKWFCVPATVQNDGQSVKIHCSWVLQSNLQVWRRIQQLPFAEQWEWYEARYRYLQDRQTIRGRREARRRAYSRNHGVSPAARSRRRTVRRVRVRQEQVREQRRRVQRRQQ